MPTPQDWNEFCQLIEEEKYNHFYESIFKDFLEQAMAEAPAELPFTDEEANTLIEGIIKGDLNVYHPRSGRG